MMTTIKGSILGLSLFMAIFYLAYKSFDDGLWFAVAIVCLLVVTAALAGVGLLEVLL